MSDLLPNAEAINRWLNDWPHTEHVVLTAITPDTKPVKIKTQSFEASREQDAARAWIIEQNSAGRNCYFHVNEPAGPLRKKAEKADIAKARWLYVDIDPRAGEDLPAEQQRIRGLLNGSLPADVPPPTAIIASGSGYQALWALAEPYTVNGDVEQAAEYERYNRQLELRLGGDNCHNVDRIFRVPGTVNWPDERKRKKGRTPALAEMVEYEPDRVYPLPRFKQAPARSPQGERRKAQVDRASVQRIADVGELPTGVSDRAKVVISQGHDPDEPDKHPSRSEWLLYVCCELVRGGCDDDTIYGIITDPDWAISDSVLDKGRKRDDYAFRQIEQARAKVTAEQDNRPQVLVVDGRLNQILEEAEQAMMAAGSPVYEHGSQLVRIVRQHRPSASPDGLRRDAGALVITPASKHWLTQRWANCARWCVPGRNGNPPRPVDPPIKYAEHYIAAEGERNAPALFGILNAPTLRPDGSVLEKPGYDESTGLLYDPGATEFPPLPPEPTEDDARAALQVLASPLRAFPFVSKAAESVALALVLTALVRRSLPTAPMFLLDSPTPGTGKSLIAKVAGTIATGHLPTDMSQGATEEELEKRLFSALRAGDATVLIDNVTRPITGDFLCSMLTSPEVKARVLGKSENQRVPTGALVMATGNNVAVRADMCRRVVLSRLDARVENPELRQFDFDPVEEARRDRAALVVAGLTALRAYVWAGRPRPLPALGSFAEWGWVRETLVWLGYHDPAATQADVRNNDEAASELGELLAEWRVKFGTEARTVGEVWATADEDLTRMMVDRCGGTFNSRKFGRWLARHQDQIVGALQLRRARDRHKQATWYVAEVAQDEGVWHE